MTKSTHVPVVIIGAGPTGLTLANLLGQRGVATLVLDRNPDTMDIPRAIVLDDEGTRTLQSFGVAAQFLPHTIAGEGSRYYDDAGTCFAVTGSGPRTYGFPMRNFMFQPDLERVLVASLRRYPSVDLRFEANVVALAADARGATLTVDTAEGRVTVRTDWLLACDGGRSFVRQALDVPFAGSTYEQDWLVIDTADDPDDSRYSKFFCRTDRPQVSIPSPRGGRRYEFMMLDGEDRDAILSDAALAGLMAPYRPYRPQDVVRRTVYTFHARIAERWRQGRVLLLGDAAHLTPPFAGQGMNAGLRDTHNVAWKIAAVLDGVADEAILDSYEQERRDPAWAMIQLAVAMGQIVMPQGAQQVAFRDMLVKALEPFPGARDYFLQLKFKPKPRYDAGLFVDLDAQPYDASLVGGMLPQPDVVDADGRAAQLDDLLGPGFALVAQDDAGEAALARLTHPLWPRLRPARLRLRSEPTAGTTAVPWAVVTDQVAGRPLATHRDQVLLVRPDRYVCGAFAPADEAAFAGKLETLLKPSESGRMSA